MIRITGSQHFWSNQIIFFLLNSSGFGDTKNNSPISLVQPFQVGRQNNNRNVVIT